MIPHETIEIFNALWWRVNLITISIIIIFLLFGYRSNLGNKEKLAKIIGLILIFRTIGVHFYWDYLGIWTIKSSLPLHLCGLSAILSGIFP